MPKEKNSPSDIPFVDPNTGNLFDPESFEGYFDSETNKYVLTRKTTDRDDKTEDRDNKTEQ